MGRARARGARRYAQVATTRNTAGQWRAARTGCKRFLPGIHFVWMPGFLCVSAASGRGFSPGGGRAARARRASGGRLAGRLEGA